MGLQPDGFTHELIMVVREAGGRTLFTGCGHRGIVNMIETVRQRVLELCGRFPVYGNTAA